MLFIKITNKNKNVCIKINNEIKYVIVTNT